MERYLIIVIVVWRVTHLVNAEDGPFDLIYKWRKLMGNSFFGKLMDCFYCLSIWIGLIAALFVDHHFPQLVILCLYYSGASILLEKLTNKQFT